MHTVLCSFYVRLNTFLKDFKRNVRFDPEITVCHMSDIVLDKKLQLKTKMCLLIKVFENKQFSLSHTSATILNVVDQEGSTRQLRVQIFPRQTAALSYFRILSRYSRWPLY